MDLPEVDTIRDGLPNRGEPHVDDDFIEGQIQVWTSLVAKKGGQTLIDEKDPIAVETIRLGATGRAWVHFDSDVSRESPQGDALVAQAQILLEVLDQLTAIPGEHGSIGSDLVSQSVPDDLWKSSDFAFRNTLSGGPDWQV